MSGYTVIFVGVVSAVLSVASYYLAPKGDNHSTWQMSLILTIACFYLLWAITYLCQLHPLEAPAKALA
ncbi:V-type ATPase V0 subunit E [Schizosaccharomyces japonicus yFS275]|uniref:V-type ATPase V0 subunit E n=1 Tax=Schizosaccharomyces japonicus (strain yFS275 / FY16936) TaxID=402676 RepID=B6K3R9_SCHJY|nr:V-type ATPase V0 subunit E [Schizosaccharomyces japonicus yFS275]EEB08126.1 V-type ATPase V0 subunit E [Schizosaccharomyces japonicus yFS275]